MGPRISEKLEKKFPYFTYIGSHRSGVDADGRKMLGQNGNSPSYSIDALWFRFCRARQR